MDIVSARQAGVPEDELTEYFSSRPLTLSEVHAALTYYYDHQAEVDAALAEDASSDIQPNANSPRSAAE